MRYCWCFRNLARKPVDSKVAYPMIYRAFGLFQVVTVAGFLNHQQYDTLKFNFGSKTWVNHAYAEIIIQIPPLIKDFWQGSDSFLTRCWQKYIPRLSEQISTCFFCRFLNRDQLTYPWRIHMIYDICDDMSFQKPNPWFSLIFLMDVSYVNIQGMYFMNLQLKHWGCG